MGIGKEYLASQHWNYFLSIESDLSVMARWVEFDPDNYKVYSLEMARLLLTACSEVDVIAKAICEALNSSFNRKSANLHTCGKLILETFPDVAQEEATIPRHGLTLNPWLNWKNVCSGQVQPDTLI